MTACDAGVAHVAESVAPISRATTVAQFTSSPLDSGAGRVVELWTFSVTLPQLAPFHARVTRMRNVKDVGL